jgi:acetyl esterase/lipase
VVSPEYRRVPGQPELATGDLSVALRRLPARMAGRHDGRVLVVGHSAGGHLALWAAACAPPPMLAGTLALAPLADLAHAHALGLGRGAVRRFLGAPPEERAGYDPARLPTPVTPVSLVEAELDGLVPADVVRGYAEAHPCRLLRAAGARHFSLIDPENPGWRIVPAELRRLSG